ncbi:enoyl-CoA hydratase/carnithine racemase [Microbacterium aurum]|nr:enoyl-CoA hydratase/carnithine racemase [Microbacterium aurum]
MNTAQWTALLTELRVAEDDPGVRAILLSAEGRAFCAGNDIKETSRFAGKGDARAYFLDLMVPALAALASSRLPIVAAAHGMALGAGLELLQFCDVVIAGESCRFQLPETKIGLWATVYLGSASHGGGRRMSQYLTLTSEPIDARTAHEAGLVTTVVPDDQLLERALEVATSIAGNAPEAVAASKAFANRTLINECIPVVRDALTSLIDHTLFEPEGREGITSFIEKRRPQFA